MRTYIIKRLLLMPITFLGATLLVFSITFVVPGGPVERFIGEMRMMSSGEGGSNHRGGASFVSGDALSPQQEAQIRKQFGMDKPVHIAYLYWLKDILTLDLGRSTRYHEPVWDLIVERLPISAYFGIITALLTYLICVPLGIFKALWHRSFFDSATSIFVFLGYAVPPFAVGLISLILFASTFSFFPLGGFTSDNFNDLTFLGKIADLIHHTTLPIFAYLTSSLAMMTFLMKNSMMDQLSSEYLKTAMAKGVNFRGAVFGHAIRNSIIPLASNFGSLLGIFLAGSFLVEKVFNIDGLGLFGFDAVVNRDYPVIMGLLAISVVVMLLGNLISDLCVAAVDPRIRFDK